ncbi:MAG: hypothetical protein K2K45_06415 [Muribaculaceae bacterium]|nr:hypothetical protein [Muribaculaceae bacterium]
MEKEPFYWITMSYAGVFDNVKLKRDSAEEKNLANSLYFKEDEIEDAYHLMNLIKATIKANYKGAESWYDDLPKDYIDLISQLKIDKPK